MAEGMSEQEIMKLMEYVQLQDGDVMVFLMVWP